MSQANNTKPVIVQILPLGIDTPSNALFDVVINCDSRSVATAFAKNYFGDSSGDYRNNNVVEYLYTDWYDNWYFRVSKQVI